ncbi:MAG: beta-ketoacyl-ACP synthase II [Ardenticatenales bacterium]|nr:beta-ketoacyl-ACP synthase II [Ardenticatenales bacterium]
MATTSSPRVVITGFGAVTPLGLSADALWEGLVAGRSGITRIRHYDATDFPVQIAGYIHEFEPTDYIERKEARRMTRFTQLTIAAAQEAVRHAALDLSQEDTTRVGVEIGNATGSIETTIEQYEIFQEHGPRRLVPTVIPGAMINMAACQVAMTFGARGPAGAPVAACATGLYAVGDAYRRLQRGEADVMIAGAGESFLHPLAMSAFWRIQALSTRNEEPERASRPFAKDRDGTVISEGAAVLILETEAHARARGATILAEVVGYGLSQDAFHLIAPDPEGAGAARAIRGALAESGVQPEGIDWISAHATATPLNDLSETLAIKHVFGEHAYEIPISGLKSMLGHMLAAAGAASVIATVKAIQTNQIPPTTNYEIPDPVLDLDYVPNVARALPVDIALSNAFGFGGQNACLIVRRYNDGEI